MTLLGMTLLVTGCVDPGAEDSTDGGEQTQQPSGEDESSAPGSPDGSSSGEADDDEGDDQDADGQSSGSPDSDTGDSDTGDSGAGEPGQPPEMADVEDALWDAVAEQESVSMRVEQPWSPDDAAPGTGQRGPGDGTDAAALLPGSADRAPAEEDTLVFDYSGDIAGEGSQLEYSMQGAQDTILVFGETGYQTVDGVVNDFESQVPEGQEAPFDPDELRTELEAAGSWVEIDLEQAALQLTTADYVDNVERNMQDILGTARLSDLDLTAEAVTRDGTELWVYSDGEYEITMTADAEEPLLMGVEITDSPYASTIELSDWNSSDSPDAPDDGEIVDLETVEEIVTGLLEDEGGA